MAMRMSDTTMRGTLIAALEDAIEWRQDKYIFCSGCEKATTNVCADHEDDDARTGEYETALKALKGLGDPAVAVLLAGSGCAA